MRKLVLALAIMAAMGGGTLAYNALTAAPAVACTKC
jgi:hypothetical protein